MRGREIEEDVGTQKDNRKSKRDRDIRKCRRKRGELERERNYPAYRVEHVFSISCFSFFRQADEVGWGGNLENI